MGAAFAQRPEDFARDPADMQNQNQQPSALTKVGIDQDLGAQVPLDLKFRDETGHEITLGDYFHSKRPVMLALVYYDCPMLCNQVLNGLTSSLDVLKFTAGKEFDVVAVSFDPRENPVIALDKKQVYMKRYGRPGSESGWHFLTGKQPAIDALTKAVGFHYVWDPKTQQFAHSSAIILVTPEGKVAQYYYGIEYSPNDMRLGIIQASKEHLGTIVDAVVLYCYHYDPRAGKYSAITMRIVRLAGLLTLLTVGSFVVVSLRHEKNGGGPSRTGRTG